MDIYCPQYESAADEDVRTFSKSHHFQTIYLVDESSYKNCNLDMRKAKKVRKYKFQDKKNFIKIWYLHILFRLCHVNSHFEWKNIRWSFRKSTQILTALNFMRILLTTLSVSIFKMWFLSPFVLSERLLLNFLFRKLWIEAEKGIFWATEVSVGV